MNNLINFKFIFFLNEKKKKKFFFKKILKTKMIKC